MLNEQTPSMKEAVMLIGDYHIAHMAAANSVHTLEGWN